MKSEAVASFHLLSKCLRSLQSFFGEKRNSATCSSVYSPACLSWIGGKNISLFFVYFFCSVRTLVGQYQLVNMPWPLTLNNTLKKTKGQCWKYEIHLFIHIEYFSSNRKNEERSVSRMFFWRLWWVDLRSCRGGTLKKKVQCIYLVHFDRKIKTYEEVTALHL